MFACSFFCRSILSNGLGKGRSIHLPCKDVAYTQSFHSCLSGHFRPAVTSSFKGSRNPVVLSYWKNMEWRLASSVWSHFPNLAPNHWSLLWLIWRYHLSNIGHLFACFCSMRLLEVSPLLWTWSNGKCRGSWRALQRAQLTLWQPGSKKREKGGKM